MKEVWDTISRYGYECCDAGVKCRSCGAIFPRAEGSVMRGHAKRCAVNPRHFPTPGVCDA